MEKQLKSELRAAKKRVLEAMGGNRESKALLDNFIKLQKQSLNEPVEIIVPTSEVLGSVDLGNSELKKTIRGYLYTVKGGMQTFVDMRLRGVYEMLDSLYVASTNTTGKNVIAEGDDADALICSAIMYVMQAPIFACLSQDAMFSIAIKILSTFQEGIEKDVENAELKRETQQDIEDNIISENAQKAFDNMTATD